MKLRWKKRLVSLKFVYAHEKLKQGSDERDFRRMIAKKSEQQ